MLRTKSGLPKHCSWNCDQHGKRRVRFRKGGFSTYLTGTPWSEDFMRQHAAALDGANTPLLIPIIPALAHALEAVPRSNLTFLVTERGAPFTTAGFGNWFRDRCDEAGLPQCSAHGLRKLAATRLAEAGCSEREIMAITGHKSLSEVSRYTKAAEQSRLAEQAMHRMLRGAESEQKLSSTPTLLDKTASK